MRDRLCIRCNHVANWEPQVGPVPTEVSPRSWPLASISGISMPVACSSPGSLAFMVVTAFTESSGRCHLEGSFFVHGSQSMLGLVAIWAGADERACTVQS